MDCSEHTTHKHHLGWRSKVTEAGGGVQLTAINGTLFDGWTVSRDDAALVDVQSSEHPEPLVFEAATEG